MPKQPFRKVIANFSKGFATYLGELDIPDDVFLIYKNLSNFFPGKLKKAPKDIRITENNLTPEIHTNGKQYVMLYKSSWTISSDPENTPKTYYLIFIKKKNTDDLGILIHEASSSDKSSDVLLGNTWEWWTQDIGWDIDSTEDIDIDFFAGNGSIRISDSNMSTSNVSKWFGHIKRDVFGYSDTSGKTDGSDLYLIAPSPSRPIQAESKNAWYLYDQHIKPPTAVKLSNYLDRDALCNNIGEVGIFVQDPWINTRNFTGNVWEDTDRDWWGNFSIDAMVWPDTGKRQNFSEMDRYATTFIYDYISESELSRDEFGNLGVSGFPCYEPPHILDEQEDTEFSEKPKYDIDKVQNYIEFDSPDDLQTLVGRVIRIGSEKMYVIRGRSDATSHVYDNCVTVMRGVLGTSPQEHSGSAGAGNGVSVYFVQETQPARAVSIAINTGSESSRTTSAEGVNNLLNSSGNPCHLVLTYNKKLGNYWGQKITFEIEHTTTAFSLGTMSVNTFEVAIINNSNEIKIILKCENGGGRTFTCQQIVDILTSGACSGKTAVFPGVTPGSSGIQNTPDGLTAERLVNFFDDVSLVGAGDGSQTADRDTDISTLPSGSDSSDDWNSRITGVNLYWNPEGETDWYLVNSYDIRKGATDEPTSSMSKSFQVGTDVGKYEPLGFTNTDSYTHPSQGDTNSFTEESQAFSGNTGAWIELPFSSPLFTMGEQSTGSGDGGANSTYNWAMCNRWGVTLSPQDVASDHLYGSDNSPTVTVRNAVACPPKTLILASPVGKQFDLRMKYTTDLIHDTYYATVATRIPSNGTLNNSESVKWQGKQEDTAFFGGVALNAESTGETLGKLTFNKENNTINIGISNVNLEYFGYTAGAYIFVATDETSLPVNGMYRIESIGNGDKDTITVDADFRPIPMSGEFTPAETFLSGTSYFANDAGLALSYPPMHGYGPSIISLGQGVVTPIDTLGTFGDSNLTNPSASSYGFYIEGFATRQDVIGTRRLHQYGFRTINYRDKLDRAAKDRCAPVRWSCSTQVSGMTVIGNVDVMDENEQTVNERGKILWTSPYRFDEFTLAKSRTIGRIDAEAVVALESFSGGLIVVKESDSFLCDPSNSFAESGVFTSMGTKWKGAVVATPKGVCVANDSGVFLLPSGEQLTLSISDTYHRLNFNNPVLAYSPKKNEILFMPDTSEENATTLKRFIFNFDRASWIEESCDDSQTANQLSKVGNFFVGDTGLLEYISDTQVGVKISRVPSTFNDSDGNEVTSDSISHLKETAFRFKSKKYTFDDPSQKKYIEYMYITYKFGANIKLKLYTDGSQVGETVLPPHSSLKNRKIPIKREGKTFQYELIQQSDNSLIDLEIEDIIVEGFYSGKQ